MIKLDDIQAAVPAYEAKLDTSFFRVRLDRATDPQRAYLRAGAQLGPMDRTIRQGVTSRTGTAGNSRITGLPDNQVVTRLHCAVMRRTTMFVPSDTAGPVPTGAGLDRPGSGWDLTGK